MPYAELNSYDHVLCNVDDIDGLKRIFGVFTIQFTVTPEAGSDGMCTTDHANDFFLLQTWRKNGLLRPASLGRRIWRRRR